MVDILLIFLCGAMGLTVGILFKIEKRLDSIANKLGAVTDEET